MAERSKRVDPLADEAERAHEIALRGIERDPVLADSMQELKAGAGPDPFHYDLLRKRTDRGLQPPEKLRGGTQPNLPAPSEKDTLVDVVPPVPVDAPPPDMSRTDQTVVVPRVRSAPSRRPIIIGVVGLALVACVVAIVAASGSDVGPPKPAQSTAPGAATPAPTVSPSPRVTAEPPASVPTPLVPSAPLPASASSAVPKASASGVKPPPTRSTAPTPSAPTAPPAGSHKSSVPEKPIF